MIGLAGAALAFATPGGVADQKAAALDGSCLEGTTSSIVKATGRERDFVVDAPGQVIDASGVTWIGSGQESTLVGFEGEHPTCFSGGAEGAILDGGFELDAMYECTPDHCPDRQCPRPCYAYHSAAGLGPDAGGLQIVEDVQIRRTGDGISLQTAASRDVIARRVYMYEIHDDAFESDFGLAGFTAEDNLVDGAYTAFAMRMRDSATEDQRDELWTIRDNLIRLREFPNGYRQRPGHGNVFKLDNSPNEPRFRMTGNTVVIGPDTGGQTLFPPVSRVEECRENLYLFVGTEGQWQDALVSDNLADGGNNGERMAALNQSFPGCFEVRIRSSGMSEDDFLATEGWSDAVDRWKAEHVAGLIG
ncbi:MAG: hypothetical protein HKN72_11000 [Gemmatimonadetes bacterium]|nr:hypothetical protein [Gemmatimonadota bacterium]